MIPLILNAQKKQVYRQIVAGFNVLGGNRDWFYMNMRNPFIVETAVKVGF